MRTITLAATLLLATLQAKPQNTMKPGTVITIPAEVKHWHGAARNSWFQHLTYHKDVQPGASNEWLEPVTDDVYNKVK